MGSGGQPNPRVTGKTDDAAHAQVVIEMGAASDVIVPAVAGNSVGGNRPQMDDSSAVVGNPGASSSATQRVKGDPKPRWVDHRKLIKTEFFSAMRAVPRESPQATDSSDSDQPKLAMRAVPRESPQATDSSDSDQPNSAMRTVPNSAMRAVPRQPPQVTDSAMHAVPRESPQATDSSDSDHPIVPQPEPELMASMKRQLQSNEATAGGGSFCCIYEIPHTLRRGDEEAYSPLVVTLGPLLQPQYVTIKIVEAHKWSYMREALSATGDFDNGLGNLLQEIRNLEQRARKSYSKSFKNLESNAFVSMMVLDGCFILQILLKETERRPISSDDPIFHQRWLFHKVKRDLMLLPNQIPFFVLEHLFALLAPSMGIKDSLLQVVHDFFKDTIKGASRVVNNPKHLLHILHSNLFPDMDGQKATPSFTNLKPFPGATRLLEAGVEFESSRTDRLDITFEDGVVKVPHFVVQDDTKPLFLNLTAFEQLHPRSRPHVTAYTFFMHCLINTAEDVSILCRKGVIENWLGSDQEVADLFGQLGRDITIYPNEVYMADVIGKIDDYSSERRNAWRANFMHNYVRRPWAIVSLTGAVILLILTVIQTFFAVFAYFQPPSSG